MNNFNYCPQCSSKSFKIENLHRFECHDCGFIFYQNIAAAVAVIIENDNHLLFTKRSVPPSKGMLDLPGGFTDPKETAEETCVRELKEELNLDFKTKNFTYFTSQPNIYRSNNVTYRTEDLIFTADLPKNHDIKLELDEIQAITWIKKEEIDLDDIAFISQQKAVKKYLS
ncbi:MAG TPA: NUDIX hydrolase [Flavobacteriaceae bacterium]|nr:NUDIX hydrolase [Flavobacteriaceae bacterium]